MIPCLLCFTTLTNTHFIDKNRTFCKCRQCGSVFADPTTLPEVNAEKQRYELHQNNPEDRGYLLFIKPLIDKVLNNTTNTFIGLDFGSGPTPIIGQTLKKHNYKVYLFDPFFQNDLSVFNIKYDFIVACEVIEHMHNPLAEFKRLYNSLKPGAQLFCMTDLLPPDLDFEKWYYKNDFTHVIFYSKKNLAWIKNECGFKALEIDGRVITFTK